MKSAKFIVTFFLLLLAPAQVFGSNPRQEVKAEKRALIRELFEATRAGLMAQSSTDAMLNQMEKDLPQLVSQVIESAPEIKPREQAKLQQMKDETRMRMLRRLRELMHEKIDLADITEQMFYPLYDKYFNEDELRGLVAFYKSPVGQKAIDVLPALMQEALARASELIVPKLTPIVTQVMDEEKQRLMKGARKQ